MSRTSHAGNETMAISVRHTRLSDSRTTDVETVEAAIGRFTTDPRSTNNCQVVFFEGLGDGHLHVNVTHTYKTQSVDGWAGPGEMPNGFVHNRMFRDTSQNEMIRLIRDMVFAPRTSARTLVTGDRRPVGPRSKPKGR